MIKKDVFTVVLIALIVTELHLELVKPKKNINTQTSTNPLEEM